MTDLDAVSPHNWLDDTLWLALAYHTWRAPLIINSNWWLLFKEDPQNIAPPVVEGATNKSAIPLDPNPKEVLPAGAEGGGAQWIQEHPEKKDYYYQTTVDEQVKPEWVTDWQLRRASWIVHRFADYRTKVQR